jgi:hypothetical protein
MKSQKAVTILMVTILMLSTAIAMLSLPANAQTSGEMASYAYISVEPNPVGVGQTTYIAMWVDFPMPSASESNSIRRHDYKLTIIAPDGKTETKTWAEVKDTTGVQSTSYTPTQAGNYTLFFEYPKQNYTWSGAYSGVWFLADNATATLTVQQDPVTILAPDASLPTEYWSRPIYGTNDNWYVLGSNWLQSNYLGTFQQSAYSLWQKDGTGPDGSHIMWTAPLEDGGVVGGSSTYNTGGTYYSGGSYEGRFQSAIIMAGRLYYKAPLSNNPTSGAYICRDLRTGEIIWQNNNASFFPTFGEVFTYESPNQHGSIPNGYLWQTVTPAGSTSNQTWMAYDSLTGNWLFNLTDVPSTGTIAYTSQGEIVKYILNYNTTTKAGWLALWNWTSANGVPSGTNGVQLSGPGSGTSYLQYRPIGKNINASTAYSWNVSITADLTGKSNPSISYVLPGDVLFGISAAITPSISTGRGTPDPYTVWTLDLTSGNEGHLIWKRSIAAPSGNTTRTLGPIDPVNRVWTMTDSETMQWIGYDLDTGADLWGPTDTPMRSMQYFASGNGAGQRASTAYGNLYVQGFGGEMFAYDCKTGNLLWKFNDTDSGIDTSWGLIPIFIAAIADGKVYAFNNEHSPNSPLYNGYNIYCLNATTGEEIYKMLGWSGQSGGPGSNTAILADGSLLFYNYYDNQVYCIAKGATQTTVSAPNLAAASGQSVVISGTVMDIAPATKQNEQLNRFPSGVPVASDASESAWMEYVYMDQNKPTNFTGVTVAVNVIDANGNYRTIGTAQTDETGHYCLVWTPDIAGKFEVTASFAGSKNYYGSSANAAFAVDAPVATATPMPTQAPSAADLYFLPAIAGLFVAIIVSIALTVLVLTKKP